MTTAKPSLRDIAKTVSSKSSDPNTYTLADQMFNAIAPADYGHYLHLALTSLAPTFKADMRRNAFKPVVATSRGEGRADKIKPPKQRTQTILDPVTLKETKQEAPEYTKYKSAKQQIIKDEWDRFLEQNLPTDDGYILIRDAGVKELRRAAEIRRQQADKNNAEAKKYDNLANVLTLKSAIKVGLLTAEDVRGEL